MDSVIFGGFPDTLNPANATEYTCISGGKAWTSSSTITQIVSTAGKIKNLYVELDASAGTGADDTYTFALYYDGSATALTCAIVQGATSGSDTTHEIDVVAGKKVSLQCVSSGSPDHSPNAQWSVMFSGATPNESLILGEGVCVIANTAYYPLYNSHNTTTTATENDARTICPTAGTIKNLYVVLDADPGDPTAPDGYRFTLRTTPAHDTVMVSSSVTCTISANDVAGNSGANSVAVAAGDILTLMIEPLNVPSVAPLAHWGFTFVADTDGESILLGGSSSALSNDGTARMNSLVEEQLAQTWTATEASRQEMGQICVLKNLYVLMAAAPYQNSETLDKYTFTVRSNTGVSTAITCAVIGNATTANDITNTATLAAMDNICLMGQAASSPTASAAYWGLVCYIAPVLFKSFYPHILAH